MWKKVISHVCHGELNCSTDTLGILDETHGKRYGPETESKKDDVRATIWT